MNNKKITGKRELEMEKPWRVNFGVILEINTKEPGFQA
jgi:hypothetical protein